MLICIRPKSFKALSFYVSDQTYPPTSENAPAYVKVLLIVILQEYTIHLSPPTNDES